MLKAENAYRTITEVAELLQVPATVLRFWETQFHQIKPMKRMGRRYYQAQDVVLLARIRDYLYKEGYTIKGVQKRLKNTDKSSEVSVFEKEKNNAATDTLIREISDIKTSLEDYI
ncbi:MAG: MerR family transcriptional regulator [Alphaproteobacteria bacterium]|nr:MerR family transcriptional regulator [Alphaproteobacteria bacterium]